MLYKIFIWTLYNAIYLETICLVAFWLINLALYGKMYLVILGIPQFIENGAYFLNCSSYKLQILTRNIDDQHFKNLSALSLIWALATIFGNYSDKLFIFMYVTIFIYLKSLYPR